MEPEPSDTDLNSLYVYSKEPPQDLVITVKEKSEHEVHCRNCINSRKCHNTNILRRNETTGQALISCRIVQCRFICGQEFHQCKQEEHDTLCPNIRVPCLNVDNGCPVKMERRLRAKHLHTCPASVVVCTMEWNRWPLPVGKNVNFIAEDNSQLDVVFLKRDEQTAMEWRDYLPSKLQNRLKTSMNEKNPVMPLGVSGHRIPKCIQAMNLLEKSAGSVDLEVTAKAKTKFDEKSSLSGNAAGATLTISPLEGRDPNDPPGFQGNASNHSDVGPKCFVPKDEREKNVRLDLTVEVVPRSKLKPRNIYTFMCAREFRRDEFANHFRSVHSEITTQLNGWLFCRCPLANQGCSFGVDRMFPHESSHRVIYNHSVDAFCTTCIQDIAVKAGDCNSEDGAAASLCDLPFEVLVHLTTYLDPLSLSALSMTNFLLREVCALVVAERGIVVLQWEKNEQSRSWKIQSKKWMFSTSFSTVPKWNFGDIGRMNNHMKSCTHFERLLSDKPFCYPVRLEDL